MRLAAKFVLFSFLTLPWLTTSCGDIDDVNVQEGAGGTATAGAAGNGTAGASGSVGPGSGGDAAGGTGGSGQAGSSGQGGEAGAMETGGEGGSAGNGGSAANGGGAGSSGSGGAPTNEPGIGVPGQPCAQNGDLACHGHAVRTQLQCLNGTWADNGTCPSDERCDTSEANRGMCESLVPECEGEDPGAQVCQGLDLVECGPDLVSVTLLDSCYACRPDGCYCPAGSAMSAGPEHCTPCPDETYSAAENAAMCSAWTNCTAGQRVSQDGTPASNRQCAACAAGTYSVQQNAPSCTNWVNCEAGQYVSVAGTATSDRQCAPCPIGTFSTAQNASSCSPASVVTGQHTCILLTDGNVRCWGTGALGRLGLNNGAIDIGDNELPASVPNVNMGASAVQISAMFDHTCARTTTGNVRCWGAGASGRLGYGNTNNVGDTEFPSSMGDVDVGGSVLYVGAGGSHTCALLAGGSVRCWGFNGHGQLGYANIDNIGDTEIPSSVPNPVDLGGTVSQLAVGGSHSCAVLTNGNVRCWGFGGPWLGYPGRSDHIGDDETPASAGNVDVGTGTITQVVVGGGHACVLFSGGNVRCWGQASAGQLGYANTNPIGDDETPASAGNVNVGGTVVQLAAGNAHTCALLTNGNVRCWGSAGDGRLGNGSTTNHIGDGETPASAGNVNIGGAATFIAAGFSHTCALMANGNLRCWGSGANGRLGYGNTDSIGDTETPASAGNVPYL